MSVATLRKWGGAVALSLPKKLLAALGLEAGAKVDVRIEEGRIVLAPAAGRYSLGQLEKEQRAVERAQGRAPSGRGRDRDWLEAPARGRERL
jgi:antitoxin component of MazEF toxin-antitoxin module